MQNITQAIMEEAFKPNRLARDAFTEWQHEIKKNIYTSDKDFIHTIQFSFQQDFAKINAELEAFGNAVVTKLEPLVNENNLAANLPRLDAYNAIGERVDKVIHHPTYQEAGEIIYQTGLLAKMAEPGGLLSCLSLLFLSSQAGEAGHNCPIACSAGIIRVLQKIPDFPNKALYLEKLIAPSFYTNFTGAQFLTEIQGGSDVGLNAVYAKQDPDKTWRIYGEKWFCSNAGANLIFITARYHQDLPGTKGLSLFLVPAEWKAHKNHYTLRRLKDKIGTRSMATGEIDFQGAYALEMGSLDEGFHLVMDNVLHLSRLFNSVCVLGMARRAYTIARAYAHHRVAFAHHIIDYPLVKENLARIKSENAAMLAAIFATIKWQDACDKNASADQTTKLLLRLLVNIQKYLTALWSVQHIHHAIDMLAGNGTIETFSSLPRLLRDCIVCENWEGTHNVLRMQVLKDILKYQVDQIYVAFMHQEIEKLDPSSSRVKEITSALIQFEQEMIMFKQLNAEQQSLQIRLIVDRMAILYCALMFLIEARYQEKNQASLSKQHCLDYFYMLHVNQTKITYDNHYLELISHIIAYE